MTMSHGEQGNRKMKRISLKECVDGGTKMPPEIEEGNVEYKVVLTDNL